MELNNLQRVTLVSALKKELEAEEKRYRAAADADIMDVYNKTGAKSFEVALESDTRRIPIGTASVVTKTGTWEIDDAEAWIDGATDAGLAEYVITIDPDCVDVVIDALKAAGVAQWAKLEARPVKDWEKDCTEVAGRLVFKATGEPVQGVCYVPGKTYTQLRPKSLELVNDAARAIYGSTPMGLLEGADNA